MRGAEVGGIQKHFLTLSGNWSESANGNEENSEEINLR